MPQTDTPPSMAARQIELLRAAGTAGRFAAAAALSRTAIDASRAAPAAPGARGARGPLWVSLHYGDELARRVFDGS